MSATVDTLVASQRLRRDSGVQRSRASSKVDRVYFHSAVDCDNGPTHCFYYTKEPLQSLQEKESKQSVKQPSLLWSCWLIKIFFITVPPACLLDSSLGVHEYVTANGIKFHCVAAGDRSKPLMLFLHGFPEVNLYNVYRLSFRNCSKGGETIFI